MSDKVFKKLIVNDILVDYIKIIRSVKPKFSERNREWFSIKRKVNDDIIEFFQDELHGNFIYFQLFDGKWYKIPKVLDKDYYDNRNDRVQKYIDSIFNDKIELKLTVKI